MENNFNFMLVIILTIQVYTANGSFENFLDTVKHFSDNVFTSFKKYLAEVFTDAKSKLGQALSLTGETKPNNNVPTVEWIDNHVNSDFASRKHYIPEEKMDSTRKIVTDHGRKTESHLVVTEDGYILTLHRILSRKRTLSTVLLHHGILGSSADWILLGPDKSLPYILSDRGYDVWLANARGNAFSHGHISLDTKAEKFWKFSWQQIGKYDLPAVIDYIRVKTNFTAMHYIGHSMGATAFLVLLSTQPVYNAVIKMGVLLAPISFLIKVKGPIKSISSMSRFKREEFKELVGVKDFLPTRKVPDTLMEYCTGPIVLCQNPVLFLTGIPSLEGWTDESFQNLLKYVPAGGSTDTILHYVQLAETQLFHKYNSVQKLFNLRNIVLPLALFSSSEDWLAPTRNVLHLYNSIKSPITHFEVDSNNFTHSDYIWHPLADKLIFSKILEYLESGKITYTQREDNIMDNTVV